MKPLFITNARRLRMTRQRELQMRIWFYLSWAGVHMRRAPTTRRSVEHG